MCYIFGSCNQEAFSYRYTTSFRLFPLMPLPHFIPGSLPTPLPFSTLFRKEPHSSPFTSHSIIYVPLSTCQSRLSLPFDVVVHRHRLCPCIFISACCLLFVLLDIPPRSHLIPLVAAPALSLFPYHRKSWSTFFPVYTKSPTDSTTTRVQKSSLLYTVKTENTHLFLPSRFYQFYAMHFHMHTPHTFVVRWWGGRPSPILPSSYCPHSSAFSLCVFVLWNPIKIAVPVHASYTYMLYTTMDS